MSENQGTTQSKPVTVPLSAMIQSARGYMNDAVNQIMDKTSLPAYLMDGVISEVLADIRKREICEMGVTVPAQKEMNKNG